eukprot:TRINITY_DN7352_c0_g1_i1.p1 TRINITY_DN7352_c0_g1~~TRINITY_DN7352_c0_g1_i1.p1  ORF type:complete len:374 (+),score=100.86 TRINITY_DN7352_c0_g1_i1:137-1258(+)
MSKPFGYSGVLSSEELDRVTDPALSEKTAQQTGVSQMHFMTQSRMGMGDIWGFGAEKEEAFSVKGCWTKEEDEALRQLISVFGAGKWTNIALKLPGRTGKQCRERWFNHLDDSVNHDPFSPEEDLVIAKSQHNFGNQWSKIAVALTDAGFCGRTSNSIKNHWNSTLSRIVRELEDSGVTPDTFERAHFVYKCRRRRRGDKTSFLSRRRKIIHHQTSLSADAVYHRPVHTMTPPATIVDPKTRRIISRDVTKEGMIDLAQQEHWHQEFAPPTIAYPPRELSSPPGCSKARVDGRRGFSDVGIIRMDIVEKYEEEFEEEEGEEEDMETERTELGLSPRSWGDDVSRGACDKAIVLPSYSAEEEAGYFSPTMDIEA